MIEATEVSTRARKLGVDAAHIEKDYILSCVLSALAEVGSGLTFREGTALARVYWPDFGLSEDLDFISLELQFGKPRRGWSRSHARSGRTEIAIDVNLNERACLSVQGQALDLPYSDLRDHVRTIPVVALGEILGNKWFMLGDDERKEPRDLYDV